MATAFSLYDILGVGPDSTEVQIRAAFRKLTFKHHPDRFSGDEREKAEQHFQEITEAFNVLSRPDSREKYDDELAQGQPGGSQADGPAAPRLSVDSRRRMFSTSTMASSTSSPMATASPPSVIVFIDKPNQWNTSPVIKMESGMAVSVMKVVRKFIRKRNRMMTTRIPPSLRASMTFSIARSMNDFCV